MFKERDYEILQIPAAVFFVEKAIIFEDRN